MSRNGEITKINYEMMKSYTKTKVDFSKFYTKIQHLIHLP